MVQAHFFEQFEPVHGREIEIRHEKIRRLFGKELQGFVGLRGCQHFNAFNAQMLCSPLEVVRVGVCNYDDLIHFTCHDINFVSLFKIHE